MADPFGTAIVRCLARIPRGRVTTCGAIARALGDVRAARAVAAWILDHPTRNGHRVVRGDGTPIRRDAGARLRDDGVTLRGGRASGSRFADPLPAVGLLAALRAEQIRLAGQVLEADEPAPPETVAGVDASYAGDSAFAAAAVYGIDDLDLRETATVRMPVDFPYIPTYLGYRELPPIAAALARLSRRPDMVLIDGHGRLHPARFGVACFAGVQLGLRTIGVAKHPLAGSPRRQDRGRADAVPIDLDGQLAGFAWTPPQGTRPLYVSVGHRVSLESALDLVRRTTKERMPEPLKSADRIAREMKGKEKRERGSER